MEQRGVAPLILGGRSMAPPEAALPTADGYEALAASDDSIPISFRCLVCRSHESPFGFEFVGTEAVCPKCKATGLSIEEMETKTACIESNPDPYVRLAQALTHVKKKSKKKRLVKRLARK